MGVTGSYRKRMAKEHFRVAPEIELEVGCCGAGSQRGYGTGGQEDPPNPPAIHEITYRPGESNEQTDQRYVSVAIGPRLQASLDQTNNGNKRSQIPEPANEQVRPPVYRD